MELGWSRMGARQGTKERSYCFFSVALSSFILRSCSSLESGLATAAGAAAVGVEALGAAALAVGSGTSTCTSPLPLVCTMVPLSLVTTARQTIVL